MKNLFLIFLFFSCKSGEFSKIEEPQSNPGLLFAENLKIQSLIKMPSVPLDDSKRIFVFLSESQSRDLGLREGFLSIPFEESRLTLAGKTQTVKKTDRSIKTLDDYAKRFEKNTTFKTISSSGETVKTSVKKRVGLVKDLDGDFSSRSIEKDDSEVLQKEIITGIALGGKVVLDPAKLIINDLNAKYPTFLKESREKQISVAGLMLEKYSGYLKPIYETNLKEFNNLKSSWPRLSPQERDAAHKKITQQSAALSFIKSYIDQIDAARIEFKVINVENKNAASRVQSEISNTAQKVAVASSANNNSNNSNNISTQTFSSRQPPLVKGQVSYQSQANIFFVGFGAGVLALSMTSLVHNLLSTEDNENIMAEVGEIDEDGNPVISGFSEIDGSTMVSSYSPSTSQ